MAKQQRSSGDNNPHRIQPWACRLQHQIQRLPLFGEKLNLFVTHVGVDLAPCLKAIDLTLQNLAGLLVGAACSDQLAAGAGRSFRCANVE